MARMANVYRVSFQQDNNAEVRQQLVTSMTQGVGERLARMVLELDDSWTITSVEDLGKWNKCKELMK